jgi:S1-C subfamily serine protease
VPIDTVRWIVPQIIRHGKVERIGIGVRLFDDQVTARLGVRGVLVHEVVENGPAAQAGIQPSRRKKDGTVPGDLIVAVNGKPVNHSIDLYRILDQFKAGDTVTITINRNGVEKQVPVTLKVLD